MLTFSTEQLPQDAENRLRLWLGREECDILLRVIESRMKAEAVSYMEASLKAAQYPDYAAKAKDHLQAAQRWQQFIQTISELRTQARPFEVTRIQ